MYRKSVQESNTTTTMENSVQNVIQQSQFFTRLFKLPVINSAVAVATDYYGKAKNSGGLVGKTIGLAESTSFAVAGQVLPFAQKFSPLAAPLLPPVQKVDALANYGLEQLETRAPIITRQPQEIVTETKQLVSTTMSPAVNTYNSVSTVLLGNPMAQLGFDVAENILDTVSNVLDRFLPAKSTEQNGVTSNGHIKESTPVDKSARAGFLFRKAYYLGSSVIKRVLGVAQNRVESVVSVGDNVVNTARKSLNNMLTPPPQAPTPVQNGDSKGPRNNKPKKSQ